MQMVLVKNSPVHFQSGFTLIEMLVVIIIVGILSAIAAPSWLNFVAQRRANVINDAVLQAIRQAQSEAKKNKLSYSVSFKSTNQVPEVAIYPNNSTAIWGNLVKDSSIKPGQLLLGTNITGIDTVSTTITYGSTTSQTISFDYSGNLSSSGLINSVIAVGIPTANNSTTILESTRRCVKIVTLLGSMQTEQTSKCNP
ncbi:MAG: type II secretion system GspH family protein [Chroococcus sp. CMT-3BRIN-NPC107]|nr:type II secretion system GspH family protein [Chroococcus sp. CMT-3BRIN-NPC107]